MLTIHWGAPQIPQSHLTCNFSGAMVYSMHSWKKVNKDLGCVSKPSEPLKRLTNLCHQKSACPAGTWLSCHSEFIFFLKEPANQRTLLWRAGARRRTLQVNQNHSKNRQNTSREIWVFRTPTKMAKHVILYRLHCKHFWKCKKGFYFKTLVNWFHGAGCEAQGKTKRYGSAKSEAPPRHMLQTLGGWGLKV